MGSDRMPRKPLLCERFVFVQTVVVHKYIRDQYRETTLKHKGILVWKSLYFFFYWVGGGGDGDGVSHFTVERIQFRRLLGPIY